MKRSYIASMGLTAALLVAVGGAAIATFRPGRTADPSAHPARVCASAGTANSVFHSVPRKEAARKASPPGDLLTAQVRVATLCYTYAGPVCPMAVAVPAGTLCECPSIYGPLPGVAD